MVTSSSAPKDQPINIRASRQQRDLIDQAAAAVGKSRSEFMLEVTYREAENVLLDQVFFQLDDDAFEAFHTLLETPPAPGEALRDLLNRPAPWE